MIDIEKSRRETLRWRILSVLNAGRPSKVDESLMLATISDTKLQTTQLELRRELDYLEARELVEISDRNSPLWSAELTRFGIDVVEYTVDCEPGIARPEKYWKQ